MEVWSAGGELQLCRHVGMECRRRAAAVETCRYEVPEAYCRCADVEVWSAGGVLQVCRRVGMERGGSLQACKLEVRSVGDALQVCRRVGICLKSSVAADV